MTADLDAALADTVPELVTSTSTTTPRKCRRHTWVAYLRGQTECIACGTVKDEVRSRRGKQSRNRGLSIQRKVLARMGLRHIPGSQLLDGDNDAFTAEVKSGARFSESDWHELAKQRAVCGTRMPLLVKVETPGPGNRARGTVTVDLDDWLRWYGPPAALDAMPSGGTSNG